MDKTHTGSLPLHTKHVLFPVCFQFGYQRCRTLVQHAFFFFLQHSKAQAQPQPFLLYVFKSLSSAMIGLTRGLCSITQSGRTVWRRGRLVLACLPAATDVFIQMRFCLQRLKLSCGCIVIAEKRSGRWSPSEGHCFYKRPYHQVVRGVMVTWPPWGPLEARPLLR